jgi:hypothetical protein
LWLKSKLNLERNGLQLQNCFETERIKWWKMDSMFWREVKFEQKNWSRAVIHSRERKEESDSFWRAIYSNQYVQSACHLSEKSIERIWRSCSCPQWGKLLMKSFKSVICHWTSVIQKYRVMLPIIWIWNNSAASKRCQ